MRGKKARVKLLFAETRKTRGAYGQVHLRAGTFVVPLAGVETFAHSRLPTYVRKWDGVHLSCDCLNAPRLHIVYHSVSAHEFRPRFAWMRSLTATGMHDDDECTPWALLFMFFRRTADRAEGHVAGERHRVPRELHVRSGLERLPVPMQRVTHGREVSGRGQCRVACYIFVCVMMCVFVPSTASGIAC